MKRVRRTFYGQEIKFDDLSHQNLSNMLWFNEILYPNYKDKDKTFENLLTERFGGIRLAYKPLISFPQEIQMLENKGMLRGEGLNKDVIKDGKWIGRLEYS